MFIVTYKIDAENEAGRSHTHPVELHLSKRFSVMKHVEEKEGKGGHTSVLVFDA